MYEHIRVPTPGGLLLTRILLVHGAKVYLVFLTLGKFESNFTDTKAYMQTKYS